jgi:hypothetical protein
LPTSSLDVWDRIAEEAARESSLWAECLLPSDERQLVAVFSPLVAERFALGVETIYEAYLVHFGRPRLFGVPDTDTSILLGDYLYAHGLVRIAETGEVDAVAALSELISTCARLRAEGLPGDGEAWAETALSLSAAPAAPDEVERALSAHRARISAL